MTSNISGRGGKFKGRPASFGEFVGGDPQAVFNPHEAENQLHPQIVKQARQSGQLNLTNRGCTAVPSQVWNINNLSEREVKTISVSMDNTDDRWWDQVDLTKLNLANNQIKEISEDIRNLVALQSLDLHDNKLGDLPDGLGELKHLIMLNISHNEFVDIPCCVFNLHDLKSLFLQNNNLLSLNDDISNCSRLEELNLSCNQLRTLPPAIAFLSRVQQLHVSENKLIEIPPELGSMSALRILDLSHNALSHLPSDIGELVHLEQLYLRHNRLTSLPILQNFGNLKELYCGNNKITELTPEHLEGLCGLKILELRDNKLTSIPDDIVSIQGLQRLDLTNNQLTGLPSALGVMSQLSTLSLEGNAMKTIRRDIMQRGTAHLLKFLLNRLESEDPNSVFLQKDNRPVSNESLKAYEAASNIDQYSLRNSKALLFSNKQATELPDSLLKMAGDCEVTVVNLSKNCLTELPPSLETTFGKLSELDLGFNYFSTLPVYLGNASRLAFLDIRSNRLEKLPKEFEKLGCLREICLSNNRFTDIPPCLYSLRKLEIILASDNRIQTIKVDGFSQLPVLTVLDLKNNDISSVPPELGNLIQIRSLGLEGNIFRHPRLAVLDKGTDSVMQYLRDRIPK